MSCRLVFPFIMCEIFVKTHSQYTDNGSIPEITAQYTSIYLSCSDHCFFFIGSLESYRKRRFRHNGRLSQISQCVATFTLGRMNCCRGWGRPCSLSPSSDSWGVNLLILLLTDAPSKGGTAHPLCRVFPSSCSLLKTRPNLQGRSAAPLWWPLKLPSCLIFYSTCIGLICEREKHF